nr:hypothetical protein [Tanacetum cinerariifolium]
MRWMIHACFRDELDNVVEEEDGGWICFLGGNNSSGTKKYQGSNSGDGGNTEDGVKITGGVIGFGGGIDELDNVVEEEDRGWICFLGGNNSSGTKKYQGSNSGDGGNIGDGVKIIGGVIGFGGGIGDAMAWRTSMARKRKVAIVKRKLIWGITS